MAHTGKRRRTVLTRGGLVLLLALGGLFALPPAPTRAAILPPVTVAADVDDGACDTHCSLREALNAADASPGHDTITFALPGVGPWTIYLQSTPAITQDLTVTGPGRDRLTLDGGYDGFGGNRLFTVGAGAMTIEHLTMANGYAGANWGGCLHMSGGSLTLRDVRVLGCRAPASGGGGLTISGGTALLERVELRGNVAGYEPTYGGGGGAIRVDQFYGHTTLTIRDSVIAGNAAVNSDGGGIHARRLPNRPSVTSSYMLTLIIERSTIGGLAPGDGNTAVNGGGLALEYGTLTLADASLSGNTGAGSGGGFYNSGGTATLTSSTIGGNTSGGSGGGLSSWSGDETLTNVTISGNATAYYGGAVYHQFNGTTALRFATVTGNTAGRDTGGLHRADGAIRALGSLVVGNRSGPGTLDDCGHAVTSHGYNLTGQDPECPTGGTDLTYTGALANVLDPALAVNAPGTTPDHALVPGSPAIDRIPLAVCAVANDQRGVVRPQGAACDIGAVEGAAPAAPVALTVTTVGGGAVGHNPAGSGGGPFGYARGESVVLIPQPDPGQVFTGWVVDGVRKGWAPSLSITMDAAHTVQATFAPTRTFPDVPPGRADHVAIVALASRGTIFGYGIGSFGPDDGVQRAQMAALIARATAAGPGIPPGALAPPACLIAGSWDCEDWGSSFTDRGGIDANLWRNAGTLQHYKVAFGYTVADCAATGRAFPCYGPSDPVSFAQTITFITRMMKVKGHWVAQPGAPLPYAGVPGPHAEDVRTFAFYTGGIPLPPGDWNAGATRGWFALALWAALNAYWGADGALPDGRAAGGLVP